MKAFLLTFFLSVFCNSGHFDKIFIQYQNPKSEQILVIEQDEYSVYAYIIRSDKKGIEFDGYLCSTIDPFNNNINLNKIMNSGSPPPLIKKYANDFSYVKDLKQEDIEIKWLKYKVEIYVRKEKYLIMDLNKKISYSKSLKLDGPYGKAMVK